MRTRLRTRAAVAIALLLPSAAMAHATPPDAAAVASASPDTAARTAILRQIALTAALPATVRRQRLLALAGAEPDPTGVRGVAIAHAMLRDHDPAGAAAGISRAAAVSTAQSVDAVIAYAGVLLAAGAPDQARASLDRLAARGLPPAEAMRVAVLQASLPAATPVGAAAAVLALAARRLPALPPLADPAGTLAFARSVLDRDPSSAQARGDAVRACLQLHDLVQASQLAADAVALDPNDPVAWLLSAQVAQAASDIRVASLDLGRARELRAQQLGSDTGSGNDMLGGTAASAADVQATPLDPLPAGAGTADATTPASDAVTAGSGGYRTAQSFYTNPFRDQLPPQPAAAAGATTAASTDPLTQQIDSQLATLQAQVAPQVASYLDFTGRSGDGGLAGLGSVALPVEATFSPAGYGRLRLMVRPTYLFAGRVGSAALTQAQLGTSAFNVVRTASSAFILSGPTAGDQRAGGVALDADYSYSWVEADVGTTPLGFKQQNVVGGITLTPQITSAIGLRLVGERRAITDSLLSYAGVTDPRTGWAMGGVVRNRLYAQANLAVGSGFWYAGAGGSTIRGKNVEGNSEAEAGAGLNYPVWSSHTDEIRLGLNLVYLGFDKNLGGFSFGQGGYFSPQSYVAALIPVSYSERLGRLSYLLSGSIGVQTYHSNSSPFFPTNAVLQSELVTRASHVAGLQTDFDGQNATGPSGSARGEVQYDVTRDFTVGGAATFERSGDFDEGEGLIYARYIFDGAR